MLRRIRKLTKEDIISNVYYDVEDGYGSINNTYKRAKEIDNDIELDEVKQWMSKQANKQIKNYKGYNSFIAPFARAEYQMDIMDMVELHRRPTQPRYALVVIDTFSKKGEVEPMFNKNSFCVYNALQIIFKKMGLPITVYSDDDRAFKAEVKAFFESEMINHVITRSRAHVAERFIKTLKSAIHDRVRNTDRKWEDMLPFVVTKYNKTVHSSTGNTPNDGHKDINSPSVIANLTLKAVHKRKYPTIEVGDHVKIYTKGNDNYASRKETTSRWSNTIYKVSQIAYDIALNKYYVVEGVKQRFHRHELLLIN